MDVFRGGFPPVKPCRVDPESMEGNTYLQFQHAYEEVFKILMGCAPSSPLRTHARECLT